MFGSNFASPSLADIAAVTDNNRNNNNGFDGNNGWWILIILFALFGWGRGGYGNGYGSGSEANVVYVPMGGMNGGVGAEVQRGFDNQSVINKLNGLENGICSLGYDQLAQMNGINTNIMQTGYSIQNGLCSLGYDQLTQMNGINTNVTQSGNAIQNAITQMGITNMQNANALSTQLSNCCCENRQGQADIKYAMATDTCAITTAINQAAQQIMQNDNANYRQLHDEQVAIQMQAKDTKIQEQASLINSLNLAQSQANQNQYLVAILRPSPVPAYTVQNPWATTQYGCCGSNSSCCNYG